MIDNFLQVDYVGSRREYTGMMIIPLTHAENALSGGKIKISGDFG